MPGVINAREYASFDGLGLAQLVRTGEVSAIELLEAALARSAQTNPLINAIVLGMEGEARRAIAEGLPAGPFSGVPYLLKDFQALYRGVPTSFGAGFLRDFVPTFDTETVARSRRAGLVIFGKTNTPEFAISPTTEPRLFGPTRNPWALARSAGGSSGGAAAAVAAGIAPLAHATDGGGSIRIPAAACGLFGMKISRGRNTLAPTQGEALAGAAVEHCVSRSVRDSAALLDATRGAAPGDPYGAPPPARSYLEEIGASPGRLRIAVSAQPFLPSTISAGGKTALADAARLCESLGHHVEEAAPQADFDALARAFFVAFATNIAAAIAQRAQGRRYAADDFEPVTWAAIEATRRFSAIDYLQAVQTFHRLGRQLAPFFETWDVLLTPTLAGPPPLLGELAMDSNDVEDYFRRVWRFTPFTALFNATGQPAMSVPLGGSEEGVPVGVQFAARYGAEDLLFRLAAQLEEARPWFARRAPLEDA